MSYTGINRRRFVLGLAAAAAGCSATSDGVVLPAPGSQDTALIVGPVTAQRTEWQWAARRFRRTLLQELIGAQAFAYILDTPPHPLPAESVVLRAEVLDFDTGYDLLRFAMGTGSGGATAQVDVQIRDAAGETLLAFSSRMDLISGMVSSPASGAASTDLDPMIDAVAEAAADRIARWRRQSQRAALPWLPQQQVFRS
jgi:hypothetical protein